MLMQGAMVRATLADDKTQTRRGDLRFPQKLAYVQMLADGSAEFSPDGGFDHDVVRVPCRFGKPGDRLWVKETFHGAPTEARHKDPTHPMDCMSYRATDGEFPEGTSLKWQPAIFMPRWASRITLEIVAVRVERLQAISAADAQAEGLVYTPEGFWKVEGEGLIASEGTVECYEKLWESINGNGSWDENPWVWVIEFKRVDLSLPCTCGRDSHATDCPSHPLNVAHPVRRIS